jgi:hypothetical protein
VIHITGIRKKKGTARGEIKGKGGVFQRERAAAPKLRHVRALHD